MSKDEISDWLLNILDSCYLATHDDYPDSIFWFYDKKFIRKTKICKIENVDIKYPVKIDGICIFEQIYYNKCVYLHYEMIWKFIQNNYSDHYFDIKETVNDILKNNIQLNGYDSWISPSNRNKEISNKENLKLI